jgi:tetratricopeptide (TPR) repeat protein
MGALGAGRMVSGGRVLSIALLSLAVGGCASVRSFIEPTSSSGPALNENVPTPDQFAAPYRAQAEQLERNGQLRQAVEAWSTALALAPNHEASRLALKLLRERIGREVAEHVRRGWHALAANGASEARRHFVAALALDPDSRAAQAGMSATPAPPAPELAKPTAAVVRPAAPTDSEPKLGPAPKLPSESKNYKSAAVAAKPTPAPKPTQREGTERPETLYVGAKAHLAASRDDDAYRLLVQLARVSPGYRDSTALLRDLRSRLVSQRYHDGMRLFREERLEAAIEQWRGVLELDSKHLDARRNIDQAEKMLHTLAAQQKH